MWTYLSNPPRQAQRRGRNRSQKEGGGKRGWKSDKSIKKNRSPKVCLSRPVDGYKRELVAHANGYRVMKNYHGVMLGIGKGFYFMCRIYFMVYEDIGNLLAVFFFHIHSLHCLVYNVFRHTLYFFLSAPNLPIVQMVLKAKSCNSAQSVHSWNWGVRGGPLEFAQDSYKIITIFKKFLLQACSVHRVSTKPKGGISKQKQIWPPPIK